MSRPPCPTPEAPADPTVPRVKDNAYIFNHDGFVYTTARTDRGYHARHAAVVLVSAVRMPFNVVLRDGPVVSGTAIVISPMLERRVLSDHGGLVGFNITPSHPHFKHFVGITPPGVTALNREAFSPWDDALLAAYNGASDIQSAQALFDDIIGIAPSLFARHPQASATQSAQVLELLKARPDASIDHLAEHLQVSARWAARIFSQTLGMSYRDYQTWLKQRKALGMLYSKRSLTDLAHAAGFTDSPQFTRAFQRWFAQSPSFSRDPNHVRVVTYETTNQPPPAGHEKR